MPFHRTCERCSTPFTATPSRVKKGGGRFCSHRCQAIDLRSDEERFWPKVNLNGPIPPHMQHLGECWVWMRAKDPYGYGRFCPKRTKPMLAHRFAYEAAYGVIPPGLDILHLCDNPSCVRPSHLKAGTHRENMHDAIVKGIWSPKECARTNSRLDETKVADIRARHAAGGISQQRLATEYGVSRPTVSRILAGNAWT